MEQNQILGYLGGLFQKNAPITDEVFSALKGCLTPENLETRRDASGETKRIRAAIDSLGFRHGANLDAYVEYQKSENEGDAPIVFLTIESEDGHFSSRHSKLTFKINEVGYANTILECSSRNGEGWYAYEIPTMLGVGAAYYALLAWEENQGIEAGRLDAVLPDEWSSSLEDYPEADNDERTEEEKLTSALMLLAQSAEEVSDEDDEDEEDE